MVVKKIRKTASHSRNGKHWDRIFSKPRVCDDHPVHQDRSDINQTNDTESEPLGGNNEVSERELITKLLGSFEVSNVSYISKLTPSFVCALAKTGWHHQMKALRDAIWKHIALETSIRVHIPTLGFMTYQLEFHMAHLLLRPSNQNGSSVTDDSIVDLSFLELANADGQIVPHSLHRGHMTLVICGWSDLQWTGYVFTQVDNDDLDIEEIDEFKGHFLTSEYGFDLTTPSQSITVRDARRYWLRLVAHRIQYVLQKWLYLVRTIEEGVERWKSQDRCNSGVTREAVTADDIKKSLDKTIQTMQLLRQLRDTLSATLRAYHYFSQPHGDMCYFSDITDCFSVQSSIVESFEKLTDLSTRLCSLDDSCKRFATHLGRILKLENNRSIIQSNRFNQESNMYQQASHQLNERVHKLNEETCILSKDMRRLNERSTEAACANQEEAIKTSRSTRVNVELLLLTTPLGMVLQYFSSEQEVLFFKRSPTTFVLATLVLMLLLRLLALVLQYGGTLLRFLYRKPSADPMNSQPLAQNSNTIELEQAQNV
ncbi:hypothetical protein COCMIDRAFT_41480 [Bipolaris oryzae ATCC 44560]|uniref:Uncharacterized protein n=1 Tax=Bipolaris oryzae ATCC 44560 TaxID=930090 RepID=W6YLQ3_COCMI|nr:uncharacterized protein COCMIDRAFT_41480 [Bipolaris oryzae ATCC 44560]EUC40142.1 hypothetical protein COCMIDRAFT_41480 [Bipolaris oryzae ATCC 44560]